MFAIKNSFIESVFVERVSRCKIGRSRIVPMEMNFFGFYWSCNVGVRGDYIQKIAITNQM